jgi:D-amino peptidase
MRVYTWTDIEGIAGMVNWDCYYAESPLDVERRRRMMRILTGEVNAAATAAFGAGASRVLVKDSHGPNNSMYFEDLHPDIELIIGQKGLPHPWAGIDEGFDAALIVGAHPKAGTEHGNLPHTEYTINGLTIGDAGLFAAIAGSLGIPTVFASGDHAAMEQLETWVPGIRTVATKKAYGPYSTKTLIPAKARALIADGVKQALAELDSIQPMPVEAPYEVEVWGKQATGDDLIAVFMEIYDPERNRFGSQDIEPERSEHRERMKKWKEKR